MNPRNIFLYDKIPAESETELFETLCRDKNIKIERIISNGQAMPKGEWYNQGLNEWVMVIQGKATLELENNEKINLSKGDYLLIPAQLKHRVTYTSKNPVCIWLAIHFTNNPKN